MDTNVHQGLPRVSVKKRRKNVQPKLESSKRLAIHYRLNTLTLSRKLRILHKKFNKPIKFSKPIIDTFLSLDKQIVKLPKNGHTIILLYDFLMFVIHDFSQILNAAFQYPKDDLTILYRIIRIIKCAILFQLDLKRPFPLNGPQEPLSQEFVDQVAGKHIGAFRDCLETNLSTYLARSITYANYQEKYQKIDYEIRSLKKFMDLGDNLFHNVVLSNMVPDYIFSCIAYDINQLTQENFYEKINALWTIIYNTGDVEHKQLHCGFLFYHLETLNINPSIMGSIKLNNQLYPVSDPVVFSRRNPGNIFEHFESKNDFLERYAEGCNITLEALMDMINNDHNVSVGSITDAVTIDSQHHSYPNYSIHSSTNSTPTFNNHHD